MLARRAFLAMPAAVLVLPAQAAAPLEVLASFTILADLTRAIGGALVQVGQLVGPDQDTHGYQPRPSDTRAMAAARLLVVNGLGLEGWLDRLASAAGFRGVRVLATAGMTALRRDGGQSTDPHAWQDAARAKIYVGNIRDGLVHADPANQATYIAAATAYLVQLDALDVEIRAAWAAIPRASRRIVTSHDAFGYYGAAYGVDFLAPQGIAAESQPTPRQLAALLAQIKAQKIRALFVETISNPQILRQIARETGARIGPAVYSDALSVATGPASTYLEMMRHNTRAFIAALG